MRVRQIPTWFAIMALGLPLAFLMWAGLNGPQIVAVLP